MNLESVLNGDTSKPIKVNGAMKMGNDSLSNTNRKTKRKGSF